LLVNEALSKNWPKNFKGWGYQKLNLTFSHHHL